ACSAAARPVVRRCGLFCGGTAAAAATFQECIGVPSTGPPRARNVLRHRRRARATPGARRWQDSRLRVSRAAVRGGAARGSRRRRARHQGGMAVPETLEAPQPAPLKKKVAIVGGGPSRRLAPFGDETWDVWAFSSLRLKTPRVTRWFEMHAPGDLATQ